MHNNNLSLKTMLKYISIVLTGLLLICTASCSKDVVKEPRNDALCVLNHNDALPKSFDEAMSSSELLIGGSQIVFRVSDKDGFTRYILEDVNDFWISGNGGEVSFAFNQYFDASEEYGSAYLSTIEIVYDNDEDASVTYQFTDNDFKKIASSICTIESFTQTGKEVGLKIKFPENKRELRRKFKFVIGYWTNSNDEFYPYEQPFITYNEISFVQLP